LTDLLTADAIKNKFAGNLLKFILKLHTTQPYPHHTI